jgi:hypothetical protein
MLDLPVHAWVGNHHPIHPDVVISPKIQKLLPSEPGAIVGDDGLRYPVEVLYPRYRGPPVKAQQPGHDQPHQQQNNWCQVPSTSDDPTTPGQGG